MHTTLLSYESQNCDKQYNFTLLLAEAHGLKREQYSVISKHIVCLHCYCERLKCSPLPLIVNRVDRMPTYTLYFRQVVVFGLDLE